MKRAGLGSCYIQVYLHCLESLRASLLFYNDLSNSPNLDLTIFIFNFLDFS